MTLLGAAPRLADGLEAVPLDLALADRPRLADEAGAEPSGLHLVAQRRRRQSESDCRLSEREHLILRSETMNAIPDGRTVAVRHIEDAELAPSHAAFRAGISGHALSGGHLGDEFLREAVHRVPLGGGVHGSNLVGTAYVVKGVLSA